VERFLRQAQLAGEGAVSLLFRLSVSDAVDQLVRADREWEEEFTGEPLRRVALEASPCEREAGPGSVPLPNPPEPPSRST
jgi:hypothetical protein